MTITANQPTMLDNIQPYVDKIKSVDYRKHLTNIAQNILIIVIAIGKAIRWAIPYIVPAFASWQTAWNTSSKAIAKPNPHLNSPSRYSRTRYL